MAKLIAILMPLLIAVLNTPTTDHPFVQELAKIFGLLGYSIIALQFVLSARIHWIEKPFGLDTIFKFHRQMGMFAALLLLSHPILYASADNWDILLALDHPWGISFGKIALLALAALVVVTVFRKTLSLDFERWRGIHNGLAISVLLVGVLHSLSSGGDFNNWPMLVVWALLTGTAITCYVNHKWLRPMTLHLQPYRVINVKKETESVWSLEFAPEPNTTKIVNLAGQFCFLTLHRDGPVEEHPFTIASAPNEAGHVITIIKTSGDYTKTIAQTKIGDIASISGPYGRFSYLLHPEENNIVFIAGGVGITPILSMLRQMRSDQADVNVQLLYANKTENDIIAQTELELIADGDFPKLNIIHVLSHSGESWTGEKGRINKNLLTQSGVDEKAYYICGPPGMSATVISTLLSLGVSQDKIHNEQFNL